MTEIASTQIPKFHIKAEDLDIHVQIRLAGSSSSQQLFLTAIRILDPDCPIPKYFDFGHCVECGGDLWISPTLGPQDLIALGRQCGVKVKVDRYAPAKKCKTENIREMEGLSAKLARVTA